MFLIKWKGWNHKYNTWEPQENLSCLEMMINFFKERELAHQNKYVSRMSPIDLR